MHWGRRLVMELDATCMAVECKTIVTLSCLAIYCLRMVTSSSAGKVKSLEKLVELLNRMSLHHGQL